MSKLPGYPPCIKDRARTHCGKKTGPKGPRVVNLDYNMHLLYGTMVCGECWRAYEQRMREGILRKGEV